MLDALITGRIDVEETDRGSAPAREDRGRQVELAQIPKRRGRLIPAGDPPDRCELRCLLFEMCSHGRSQGLGHWEVAIEAGVKELVGSLSP